MTATTTAKRTGLYDQQVFSCWALPMNILMGKLQALADAAIAGDEQAAADFEAVAEIAEQRAKGATFGNPLRTS